MVHVVLIISSITSMAGHVGIFLRMNDLTLNGIEALIVQTRNPNVGLAFGGGRMQAVPNSDNVQVFDVNSINIPIFNIHVTVLSIPMRIISGIYIDDVVFVISDGIVVAMV